MKANLGSAAQYALLSTLTLTLQTPIKAGFYETALEAASSFLSLDDIQRKALDNLKESIASGAPLFVALADCKLFDDNVRFILAATCKAHEAQFGAMREMLNYLRYFGD